MTDWVSVSEPFLSFSLGAQTLQRIQEVKIQFQLNEKGQLYQIYDGVGLFFFSLLTGHFIISENDSELLYSVLFHETKNSFIFATLESL